MLRFKLSPELSDGSSWSIVDTKSQLLECVGMWADNCGDCEGATCDVEVVEMSDAEVRALPDL